MAFTALPVERSAVLGTFPERRLSGGLLLLAFALNLTGVVVFTGRVLAGWFADTPTLLAWERSLFIAFSVAAALGVALLEAVLRDAVAAGTPLDRGTSRASGGSRRGAALARLAATAFVLGAAAALVVEATELAGGPATPLTPVMVVVLFVAEALLGAALLMTWVVPAWVGWAAVAWNLGWLVALPLVSPGDLYYPILHAVPLLLVGIPLVRR